MVWGGEAHWVLGGLWSLLPKSHVGWQLYFTYQMGGTVKTCFVGTREGENEAVVEYIHASLCSGSRGLLLMVLTISLAWHGLGSEAAFLAKI